MRLEPALWAAIAEIRVRENWTIADFVDHATVKFPNGTRTSAVRAFVFVYYREAATHDGHRKAGHGELPP